jgi:hypothetical protein
LVIQCCRCDINCLWIIEFAIGQRAAAHRAESSLYARRRLVSPGFTHGNAELRTADHRPRNRGCAGGKATRRAMTQAPGEGLTGDAIPDGPAQTAAHLELEHVALGQVIREQLHTANNRTEPPAIR